ncbi:D-alanine--D-alanine ligase [bacterium HR36]|nr:D-alanine--D-alanine ligase [bacterium HR36]
MLRIAVLYNEPQIPKDHPLAPSEWEIEEIAHLVVQELRCEGWWPKTWKVTPDFGCLERIRYHRPDVVFNLFEGFYPGDDSQAVVVSKLEEFGIPYTGNNSRTLRLTTTKHEAQRVLRSAGLPVPESVTITSWKNAKESIQKLAERWPLIVKPATTDASVGIDVQSVVSNPQELEARIKVILEQYSAALMEEFLPGREFNVSVIELGETCVLPISEIQFRCREEYPWPIVTYEAKWYPGSLADQCTQPVCPAELDIRLRNELERLALAAFRATECRQYARIDIRLDREGQPRILEVNANPGYHPDAGFCRSLREAGWSHADFTRALVRDALQRADFPKERR